MTTYSQPPDAQLPQLLEPDALQALLDRSDQLLLIHVSSPEAFAHAHLPGAQLVVPSELVCGVPPATGRLPEAEQVRALMARIGYTPDQTIIAYDDEGGGWAGRFLWTLDIIGHQDWGYLNGGIHAWAAAGLPLASGDPAPVTPTSSNNIELDLAPIAEIPDVLATIEANDGIVWDVRSAAEYAGQRQAAARVGHIPGAINLDWEHLKDPGNQLRLVDNLATLLAEHGITPDKQIVTHCQTHHRSGLSYLVARLLGYPRIRAYHGSWSEWGNRDDTPIEL